MAKVKATKASTLAGREYWARVNKLQRQHAAHERFAHVMTMEELGLATGDPFHVIAYPETRGRWFRCQTRGVWCRLREQYA